LSELRATVSVVLYWSQSLWNALGVVASFVKELKHTFHCVPFTFVGIQPSRLWPHSAVIRREPGKKKPAQSAPPLPPALGLYPAPH
jgi:hypothetical protein